MSVSVSVSQPRQAALYPVQQLQLQEQQQQEEEEVQHPQREASRTTAQLGRSTTGSRLRTMDKQDSSPPASRPIPSRDRLVQRPRRGLVSVCVLIYLLTSHISPPNVCILDAVRVRGRRRDKEEGSEVLGQDRSLYSYILYPLQLEVKRFPTCEHHLDPFLIIM